MVSNNDLKLLIHTAHRPEGSLYRSQNANIRPRIKVRLSFQERLLRNTFLSCAVLLGVLALNNVQHPWAIQAAAGIEKALTMKIDLDQSFGNLSFVQRIMPESALVFFNLSGDHPMQSPSNGRLLHAYSAEQPWLMFEGSAEAPVYAGKDGIVSAISPLSGGGSGILIDHGNGLESVTANIDDVRVQVGDSVLRGSIIGSSSGSIYFELRENGAAIDPTEQMGL